MSNFQFFLHFFPYCNLYETLCFITIIYISKFVSNPSNIFCIFMFPLLQFSIVFMPTGTVHVSAHIPYLSSVSTPVTFLLDLARVSCPTKCRITDGVRQWKWPRGSQLFSRVLRSVVRDSRNWLCTHFAVCFQLRPPREWQECIRRWVSPPQRQHKGNVIYPSKIALCGVTEVQMTRVV